MLRKITILYMFFIFLLNISYGQHAIKGNIEYNEEIARSEAFKDISLTISKDEFENYKKDKFYKENIKYIKNKKYEILGSNFRILTPFYKAKILLFYAVQYDTDIRKKYYYSISGNLLKYEVDEFNGEYPYKTMAYDKNGNLLNINFIVSEYESYHFDKDKNLIGYWKENEYYNKKGKKILKRDF